MEGVDLASSLISSFGFPICCAIGAGFYIKQIIDRLMTEAKEREDALLSNNSKTSDALNHLSDTMHDISQSLETLSDTNAALVNNINSSLLDINDSLEKIQHKLGD